MTVIEAFISYLLNLAASLTHRRIEKKKRKGDVDNKQPVASSLPAKAVLTVARFADDNSLQQHRKLFSSTSLGGQTVKSAALPAVGEEWKIVGEWDASHKVPKRGDGQGVNRPSLVEWGPQGNELVTACDAFGLTRWKENGQVVGGGTDEAAYGTPDNFFWNQDGSLVLLEAMTSLNNWWSIQKDGRLVHQVVSQGAFWGHYEGFGCRGIGRKRDFNPWRPGKEQLLLAGWEAALNLLDISDLPRSAKSTQKLGEVSFSRIVDLSVLGAQHRRIFRYHWHPSGQYVAVTTGAKHNNSSRTTHILHFEKGEIVDSLQASAVGLGWSLGGRLLWCRRVPSSNTSSSVEDVFVWDSHSFSMRKPSEEEQLRLPVARILFYDNPSSMQGAVSCDGKRVLVKRTPVPDGRYGLSIVDAEGGENLFDFPLNHSVYDAAWSPTDPDRLATVGGEDAPRLLRIWSLDLG